MAIINNQIRLRPDGLDYGFRLDLYLTFTINNLNFKKNTKQLRQVLFELKSSK